MEANDKREKLKEFYLKIRDCDRCELSKVRTKSVFGSGSADAKVMFVGEAPGKNEDLQGLPFVGQAGKLLDELLGSIGYDRSEIFIANVLKCRPPGNRDPRIEEIDTCKGYLMEQIKIIDPKIICTMGRFSTQLLLDTDKGISSLRGKIFRVGNHIIMPINHPAAALYTPSKMGVLKEDFQKIKRLIDSGGEISDSEEGVSYLESDTLEGKQEEDEQLGLF
jgi:DNA polymerase